jgi:hypothetical protein
LQLPNGRFDKFSYLRCKTIQLFVNRTGAMNTASDSEVAAFTFRYREFRIYSLGQVNHHEFEEYSRRPFRFNYVSKQPLFVSNASFTLYLYFI